jgi:hypothetical protein
MAFFTPHFKQYQPLTDLLKSCSIQNCENLPHNSCNHCDDHFCHDHSNEHENRCSQTISYLTNTIDKLVNRISSLEPHCLQQIERWREESFQSIERYGDKRRYDLIEKKQENLKKQLEHLQNELNETIEEKTELFNQINHNLQLIEVQLIELEHFRLTLRPLIIEENLVTYQNLFPLPHAHHTIHLKSGNECSIGSNEKHLLVEREGKHLCLIDRNLMIVNEILFNHNDVHSICWSSTINRFIIITFKEIFLFDDKTMILEKCSISSDSDWWRGTCSDDTLFLSSAEWGSPIYEFDLHSSFQLIKSWHPPIACQNNEIICDLKYNSGFLGIAILNKHNDKSRLDLRSSITLECIWSIDIHGRCRCCSINGDQWLVMDHDDRRFFHISADGRLLKTDKYEHHQQLEDVITWNENNIVVLTKKTINLHEIR